MLLRRIINTVAPTKADRCTGCTARVRVPHESYREPPRRSNVVYGSCAICLVSRNNSGQNYPLVRYEVDLVALLLLSETAMRFRAADLALLCGAMLVAVAQGCSAAPASTDETSTVDTRRLPRAGEVREVFASPATTIYIAPRASRKQGRSWPGN